MAGVSLWRIATDTRDYTADELGGRGAEATGGRWNRPGHPVVYASTTIALACLETIVHLRAGGLPMNRYLVEVRVPVKTWDARQVLDRPSLPVGWDALPEGRVSLDLGDRWLATGVSALLLVPSVIVPEEHNALINPAHPQARGITARKLRKWLYDPRLPRRAR